VKEPVIAYQLSPIIVRSHAGTFFEKASADMAKTAAPEGKAATKPTPQRLRLHPARLLYLFVVTLLVGIIYSEAQALLTGPASVLDPSQLRKTLFWQAALAYPVYFAIACVLAIGAALLGWRLDRRYSALQKEQRHEETVAVAQAVVERAQMEGWMATPGKAIPRDLPPRAPGFVGHEQDLVGLSAALRQGLAVAVVGMGGLGKSSLAAEVVHALAADPGAFPGGVTWVRCDERTGLDGLIWIADQLLATWSAALRLRPQLAPRRGRTGWSCASGRCASAWEPQMGKCGPPPSWSFSTTSSQGCHWSVCSTPLSRWGLSRS
jgi:hypothetical protein